MKLTWRVACISLIVGLSVVFSLPHAATRDGQRDACCGYVGRMLPGSPAAQFAAAAFPAAVGFSGFGLVAGAGLLLLLWGRGSQDRTSRQVDPGDTPGGVEFLQTILANVGRLSGLLEARAQEQDSANREIRRELAARQQELQELTIALRDVGDYLVAGLERIGSQLPDSEARMLHGLDSRLQQFRIEEIDNRRESERKAEAARTRLEDSLERWREQDESLVRQAMSDIQTRFQCLCDSAITVLPASGDAEEEALWTKSVQSELRSVYESTRGNAQLMAAQLVKALRALQELDLLCRTHGTELFTETELINRFDNCLFRPAMRLYWLEISENEASATQWTRLRVLETAILNYRRLLQHRLEQQFNFRVIPVTLNQTRYEPSLHESSEYYSLRTGEPDKDNLILEVIENGYRLGSQVLRKAIVRRYIYSSELAAPERADEVGSEDVAPYAAQDAASGENANGREGLSEHEMVQDEAQSAGNESAVAGAAFCGPEPESGRHAEVRDGQDESPDAESGVSGESDIQPPSPEERKLMHRAMSQG